MARLGCLLMIVAMVALCGLVVIPVLPPFAENETIDNLLAPLICQPEETIERDQYSTRDREGTSYSMNVYCVDKDGDRRDETGRWFLFSLGGFLAPFLIGLFMLIGGANRGMRQFSTGDGGTTLSPTGVPINYVGTPSPKAGQSLSERLKQLDEARNQGLISADEYDRMRKEILDKGV
ncbi:MAG: SHOCT domain-containing protein [Anaerolineae bacterium]